MSKELINGVWRADSNQEPEPNEFEGTITASTYVAGTTDVTNLITSSSTTVMSGNIGQTITDYSGYYWRWDGMRWVYEPDWTWVPTFPAFTYTYNSASDYKVIKYRGKTILYRIVDNLIEYGIIQLNGVAFKKTYDLLEILKGLK